MFINVPHFPSRIKKKIIIEATIQLVTDSCFLVGKHVISTRKLRYLVSRVTSEMLENNEQK